jgi:tetratricopeptide (TPR) repeat protein
LVLLFGLPLFGFAKEPKKEGDDSAPYTRAIAKAYYERGNYFQFKQKADDKAIADYSEAIRIDPQFGAPYAQRGWAFLHKKAYGKAKSDFAQAIKLDEASDRAHNGMAWLLATCPEEKLRDGKKAVELANKALRLARGNDPNVMDTLAAAYAENRQFDEAVKWQQKAIDSPNLPRGDLAGCRARLKLYQADKPYRLDR